MKKVLALNWHGQGDQVSMTPALRKYKQTTGNYIGWAMQARYFPGGIMAECPYIDQLHGISDAWNDFENYSIGKMKVMEEAKVIAREFGYDEIKVIPFTGNDHRVLRGARDFGVSLGPGEIHTEWFYDPDKIKHFYDVIDIPDGDFVFTHITGGEPSKSWPKEAVLKRINNAHPGLPIVSPDWSWDIKKVPIAFAIDVLKKAKYSYIVDSVIYYIAIALEIPMTLVYFKRGPKVFTENCPLHGGSFNVTYVP